MKETFYITTPIYYPNAKLHIGHTYTTVAADTISRYKKLRGYDVFFLTGVDEHGQKIERSSKEAGKTPQQYLDEIDIWIKDLWKNMNIEYDDYLRTTDKKHVTAVQKIFKILYDQGDIYKSKYEGLYCVPCETFFSERDLIDGNCPDCGRKVEKLQEESYFFKLSKYQDRIEKLFLENPDFLKPDSSRNEMYNSFIKPGLEDFAVSRTSFTWGVPVEFDPGHVVYVWIDALSNYITALGYLSEDDSLFQKYWPANLHLMAKEIVRFHSIIWPAILMALELPLQIQNFSHGWLLFDGSKMSKSKGNVVDPNILIERYGVDSLRYYLMSEIVFGQDGNFTNELLIRRINSDLANDLGNLVSRTVGMIDKYFNGQLPLEHSNINLENEIIDFAKKTVEELEFNMDNLNINVGVNKIWEFIRRLNKFTDEMEPWVLVKDENKKGELARTLYVLSESLRIISILIEPIMPNTPKKIHAQLNIPTKILGWENSKIFGLLENNIKITKGEIIFPRIDIKKELEELENLKENKNIEDKNIEDKNIEDENIEDEISIDDFSKINLKVGEVISCEKIEKSDKLLKSQIKIGNEIKQIVSGIASYYSPEEMVGKKVVVVTNLKPVKLRGILSEGMILAASDKNGNLNLVTVDGSIENGADIK